MGTQIVRAVSLLSLLLAITPAVVNAGINPFNDPLLPRTVFDATATTVPVMDIAEASNQATPVAAPTPTAGQSGLVLLIGLIAWRSVTPRKLRRR